MAHVVQEHHLTPDQFYDLTEVELALYVMDPAERKSDLGTALARIEALEKLTLEQRVELQRLLYS